MYDSNPHGLAHKLITLNPYVARVEPKFVHSASLVPSRVEASPTADTHPVSST